MDGGLDSGFPLADFHAAPLAFAIGGHQPVEIAAP
jgi:hypothetical protein